VPVEHASRMEGIEVNIAPATAVRLTNSRRVIGCIQTSSEVQQRPSQGLFTPGLLVVGSYQVAERISGGSQSPARSFRLGVFFRLVVPALPVADAVAHAPPGGLWRGLDLCPQQIQPLCDEAYRGRRKLVVGDVLLALPDGRLGGPPQAPVARTQLADVVSLDRVPAARRHVVVKDEVVDVALVAAVRAPRMVTRSMSLIGRGRRGPSWGDCK